MNSKLTSIKTKTVSFNKEETYVSWNFNENVKLIQFHQLKNHNVAIYYSWLLNLWPAVNLIGIKWSFQNSTEFMNRDLIDWSKCLLLIKNPGGWKLYRLSRQAILKLFVHQHDFYTL
jgi:hypothetical protein